VRSARREQEEERPGRRGGPHELDGLVRQPIGRVPAHEHGRSLVHGAEVAVDGLTGLVPLRDEPVPSERHVREPAERIPVEVLADERRAVAGLVEPGGERGGLFQVPAVVVVQDAGMTRVASAEQARSGGTAQGGIRERVRERHPPGVVANQLRPEPGHRFEGVCPLVVREHDDHVRPVTGTTLGDGPREPGAEPDERGEHRARHPAAGCGGAHSFRTFQMCSAGKARAHSRGA
jgi:hypothetical protein